MAYNLGLSSADYNRYLSTLTRTHTIRVSMYTMKTDHTGIENISSHILDGQVAINGNAQITTRVLTADLLDDKNILGWEASDPTAGVIFMDRMIRVYYQVHVPELSRTNKWVSVPIFTGPLINLERNGAVVSIEAHSKEILSGPIWGAFKIKKNTNKALAIRKIMNRAGESNRTQVLKTTTGKMKETSYTNPKTYWQVARSIASSLNQHMFYDGLGYLRTRAFPKSTTNSYTFSDGSVPVSRTTGSVYQRQNASILSDPEITYDISNVSNAVRVIGKKKGKKAAPYYTAYPPKNHPMHPARLGRNGRGRYLPEVIQNDKYTTVAACRAAAETRLEARLKTAINVKFDSLPIPHLEPYDWVTIKTDKLTHKFRMDEFTIPLSASGKMTVGYIRRVNVTRKNKVKRRNSTKR